MCDCVSKHIWIMRAKLPAIEDRRYQWGKQSDIGLETGSASINAQPYSVSW
jgi:hypothetical protein